MPRTLAQNAQYIAETIKPAIKQAIEDKGVTVPSTDSFLDYADRIGEISGGGSGYQLKDLPTGSISTVSDAEPLPLNALKVSVEAWQEGSGDPSPSNIRPIHGWSTATINDVRKNAVKFVFTNDTNTFAGLDFAHTVSSFTLSGTATGGYRIFQLTNLPKLKIGVTYTYSVRITGTKARCVAGFRFYKNGNEISGGIVRANLNDGDLSSISFALNSDYDAATYVIEGIQANAVFDCTVDVQLEVGDRVTTFVPYVAGQTINHAFTDSQGNPLTVYGGEWNVVDGELKQTDDSKLLSNYSWRYHRNVYLFESLEKPVKPVGGGAETSTIISSIYRTVSADYINSHLSESGIMCIGTGGQIYIRDLRYDNVNDFVSNSGNTQVKYPLATPTTIPQQPLSIRLLEGTNNLYADCGEVIEGEYFSGSAKGYVDGIKYANEGDGGIASYTNIKSADELTGATAVTFEVYARIDSYVNKTSGAYARLIEFGNSQQTGRLGFIGLASDNDNNLCYWDDTADVASGIETWTLGDTHLISVVKTTSGSLKIYIDGVLKYTGSSTLTITTSIIDYVTERGGYSSQVDSARQLNGEVYTWRVYAKELSAANIAQNLTADRSLYSR